MGWWGGRAVVVSKTSMKVFLEVRTFEVSPSKCSLKSHIGQNEARRVFGRIMGFLAR